MATREPHALAASIVRNAGGRLVGRTRLQKIVYLAQIAGFPLDFSFEFRHFGPYSEELASAMDTAIGLDIVKEEETRTNWGGWYSTYVCNDLQTCDEDWSTQEDRMSSFLTNAAIVSAVELELAATAAFLFINDKNCTDNSVAAWEETERRKPEKAKDGRIQRAKTAYKRLLSLETPMQLPAIVD